MLIHQPIQHSMSKPAQPTSKTKHNQNKKHNQPHSLQEDAVYKELSTTTHREKNKNNHPKNH